MVAKKIEFDEVHEVEFLEDSGFFFHRLGELKISKRADAGASKFWFVVSPVHGVMFLSSDNCLYSLDTSRAHSLSTKIEDSDASSELESVFNTESIQPVIEQSSNIEFMSLRDDGTLLLVCCQNEIHIYQAEDLLQKGADPLLTYKVGGVKLGAWEPTVDLKSATARLAILFESGNVEILDVSQPPDKHAREIVAENAGAFCWHPSGGKIAVGQGGKISIIDSIDGSIGCEIVLRTEDENNSDHLLADGIIWIHPALLYVSCSLLGDDINDSVPLFVSCDGSIESSNGCEIAELYPSEVALCGTSRQCLVGALLQEWHVIVSSHQGYLDDHIKVFSYTKDKPEFASITEDALSIRIPNGPDDTDNHILTLGIDRSSDKISCPHPIDKNAGDIENLPRVWILTSDGILREYIFGSLNYESCTISKKMLHRYEGQIWGPRMDVVDSSREADLLTAINVKLSGSDDDFDDLTEPKDAPGAYQLPEAPMLRPDTITPTTESHSRAEDVKFDLRLEAHNEMDNAKGRISLGSRNDELGNDDLEIPPLPESRISHLTGDFPGIEKDFLSTLFESRKMEFTCFTKLNISLQGMDLPALREETLKLFSFSFDKREYLRSVRERLNTLIANATRAYARIQAMPHFYRKGDRKSEIHRDKLDMKLHRLKERIKSRIKACRFAAEDLQETISCLVEQAPKKFQSDDFGSYSQYITLKDSITSQDGILKSQVERIERLYKKAGDLCIRRNLSMSPIPSPNSGVPSNSSLHISPIYGRLKWVSLSSIDLCSPGSQKQVGTSQHCPLNTSTELVDVRILERCIGRTGGIRKTHVSPIKQQQLTRSSDLPPMKEIGVPKLPKPFRLATVLSTPIESNNTKSSDNLKARKGIPLHIQQNNNIAQPPLPSFAQQAESKSLIGKAGLAESTKSKPVSKTTQPPLPSFAQQAEAKSPVESFKNSNKDAETGSPVNKSIPIQNSLPWQHVDSSMGKESQKVDQEQNLGIFANKTEESRIKVSAEVFELPKHIDSGATLGTFSSYGTEKKNMFSQKSPNLEAEPSNATSLQGIQGGVPKSSVVSQEDSDTTVGSSFLLGDASTGMHSSTLSEPWPSSSSNTFGSLKPFSTAHTFGQPSKAGKGKTASSEQTGGFGQPSSLEQTSTSPFGQPSGFGQPSQVGFGSTSTFGQLPASAPTAASPFGQASGFGQPSQVGFGSTSTFGQSTGGYGHEPNQPTSAFGAMSNQKNVFAQYAQQNQATFGSSSASFQRPKDSNSSMWQARK